MIVWLSKRRVSVLAFGSTVTVLLLTPSRRKSEIFASTKVSVLALRSVVVVSSSYLGKGGGVGVGEGVGVGLGDGAGEFEPSPPHDTRTEARKIAANALREVE